MASTEIIDNSTPGGIVGAIYNLANGVANSLTLTDCTISGNSAPGQAGAIYTTGFGATSSITLTDCTISGNSSGNGGALDNVSTTAGSFTATLDDCTLSDNQAGVNTSADGGAIRAYVTGDNAANTGVLNCTNCTFSGNKARNKGGAIDLIAGTADPSLTVNLVNCTIAGNTADSNDDGVNRGDDLIYGMGGGIFVYGSSHPVLNIKNCLIADNYSGIATALPSDLCRDANHPTPVFEPNIDYSILEVWSATRITLNGTGNLTGNQPSLNLAALADNGGPTETCALLGGSVAINAGTDTGAPTIDQRGYDRISPYDIGAYEYAAIPPPVPTIPTLNEWGMIMFALLIAGTVIVFLRRRDVTT